MEQHTYNVVLELANDDYRETFDFKKGCIEKAILESIDAYNSLTTVRVKKELSCKVNHKSLEITILSPISLEVPSKALAKFTRILIDKSPEIKSTIARNRVFRSIQTGVPLTAIDNISSSDTLKKLIDIFVDPKLPEDNKSKSGRLKLQHEIKKLIFNS